MLYEGKPVGTPDAGQFWRIAAEHRAKTMFTAPTAFRAIRKEDPEGTLTAGYDLTGLRYLFLPGERLDPETYHWASALLGIPVIDHWWQTKTGWPIVANPVGISQGVSRTCSLSSAGHLPPTAATFPTAGGTGPTARSVSRLHGTAGRLAPGSGRPPLRNRRRPAA